MSDDRKKYYPEGSGAFDGVDPSAQHKKATGRTGKVVDGDDLRPHVKATLKDYLKSITNDAKNVFPIEHLAQEGVTTKELTSLEDETSLYPNEGSPQKISTIVNQTLKNIYATIGDTSGFTEMKTLLEEFESK